MAIYGYYTSTGQGFRHTLEGLAELMAEMERPVGDGGSGFKCDGRFYPSNFHASSIGAPNPNILGVFTEDEGFKRPLSANEKSAFWKHYGARCRRPS